MAVIKKEKRNIRIVKFVRRAAAVALLAFFIWWLLPSKSDSRENAEDAVVSDKMKSKDKGVNIGVENSTLTLDNQSVLIIDVLQNGEVTTEAGVKINKLNDSIQYQVVDRDNAATIYNTVSSGKGKQLKVVLPDGSKAWLNTISRIRFPLAYATNERWVEISGEVYFEVEADENRPFKVRIGKNTVQAFGTRFNVKAYDDDKNVTSSLLEGSIKITTEKSDTTLYKPGQIAIIDRNQTLQIKEIKDVDNVLAWKTGYFRFQNDHITNVMKELGRWYTVDVKFLDTPSVYFSHTTFKRDKPFDSAIYYLRLVDSSWNFIKKNNRLTISSKDIKKSY